MLFSASFTEIHEEKLYFSNGTHQAYRVHPKSKDNNGGQPERIASSCGERLDRCWFPPVSASCPRRCTAQYFLKCPPQVYVCAQSCAQG